MTYRNIALLTFITAIAWGLWWVPIRWLENLGFDELWAGVAPTGVAALTGLMAVGVLRANPLTLPRRAILGAILVGLAVSFYGISLALTDVVRAALFFYLAPIWGLFIERFWLRLKPSWHGPFAAGLCIFGFAALFKFELSLEDVNWGDFAGLMSGIFFPLGATLIFTSAQQNTHPRPYHVLRLTTLVLCCSTIASFAFLLIKGQPLGEVENMNLTILIILATGILFLAPVIYVAQLAAEYLPPATLAFLYTAEIVVAVVSAAIFLPEEIFGWGEAIGAILIGSAGLVQAFKPADPA